MKEQEMIKEIIEWLDSPTGHLSTRTDHAKGYKQGILTVKGFIASIIKKYDKDALTK